MAEILICPHPLTPEQLQNQYGLDASCLQGSCNASHTQVLSKPYSPYLVKNTLTEIDRGIYNQLAGMSPAQAKTLTQIAQTVGEEQTVAIADVTAKLYDFNLGMVGATTSVYGKRMEGFAGAVQNYQERLLAHYIAGKKRSQHLHLEKNRVILAYEQMQRNYHHELNIVTAQSRAKARKGVPLSNVDRALHIARSSRTPVKLNVMSQVQASNLMMLSKQGNFLGTGLVAINFFSRVGNITNSYRAGENWERELFIESSSFTLSALAGGITASIGASIISFVMVATPAGWVGLIIVGSAFATTAAVSAEISIVADDYIKYLAERNYDRIIELTKKQ